jgi:hypothetical protein
LEAAKRIEMIPNLDNLIEMYNKMESNGWNINAPLKYGFYFVDENEQKLRSVYNELKDHGYTFEKIYLEDDGDNWWLHVSKIDTLTPEKLNKRNIAFNELASYCEIESYDGWDVEKIE